MVIVYAKIYLRRHDLAAELLEMMFWGYKSPEDAGNRHVAGLARAG